MNEWKNGRINGFVKLESLPITFDFSLRHSETSVLKILQELWLGYLFRFCRAKIKGGISAKWVA